MFLVLAAPHLAAASATAVLLAAAVAARSAGAPAPRAAAAPPGPAAHADGVPNPAVAAAEAPLVDATEAFGGVAAAQRDALARPVGGGHGHFAGAAGCSSFGLDDPKAY
jgi:hypothetical protein